MIVYFFFSQRVENFEAHNSFVFLSSSILANNNSWTQNNNWCHTMGEHLPISTRTIANPSVTSDQDKGTFRPFKQFNSALTGFKILISVSIQYKAITQNLVLIIRFLRKNAKHFRPYSKGPLSTGG